MWIYKITNIINNKVYIGQSIRPIEDRFKRHISDAINCKLDTHFARAIRKYGQDKFYYEIIDSASSQDEMNKKEQKWIRFYNSVQNGYNETDALYKCGGNTYQSKTDNDMLEIANKIRQTKIGGKNPNAKPIICINILTGEEIKYNSIIECARAIGIKNGKTSITTRLNGQITSPFHNKYLFKYCDE